MLIEFSELSGLYLKDSIIALAEALTLSNSRPGQIAGILALMTIVFSVWYFIRTRRQLGAVRLLDKKIRAYPDIRSFAEGHGELIHELQSEFPKKGPRETVREAFDEFNETVVRDDIDGPPTIRNSIRPSSFLNVDDLGFGPGFFRILPNTLDLSRFDAAPLIAFTAPKETDYGTEADGRISQGCGAHRTDQWVEARASC
ncbi:hypothetical protein [Sulfitobacter dubius]|uniref:hypothetical protein n=1 Tax=Sulfitobacter dubius TaxID=218673 RepID=UPI0030DD975A